MCSCRVNPSCVMCGGWPTSREDPQLELPTLERLSRLDLGVHPILSFPDGQFTRPLPLLGAGRGNRQEVDLCPGSPRDT